MDIQASKKELVRLIDNLNDQEVIEKLLKTLKSVETDFWSDLSKEQKDEILLGIEQLDKGERVDFDKFLNNLP